MKPIGTLHTPFKEIQNMPIQPKGAKEQIGKALLDEEYMDGLKDLDGFSHIYLIYLFHQVQQTKLSVIPFMDTKPRGVFATRAPSRPNHIGLSIVELVSVSGKEVTFRGADMLDGTPLFDIKPYITRFDSVQNSRSGWMIATEEEVADKRSDSRFRE